MNFMTRTKLCLEYHKHILLKKLTFKISLPHCQHHSAIYGYVTICYQTLHHII